MKIYNLVVLFLIIGITAYGQQVYMVRGIPVTDSSAIKPLIAFMDSTKNDYVVPIDTAKTDSLRKSVNLKAVIRPIIIDGEQWFGFNRIAFDKTSNRLIDERSLRMKDYYQKTEIKRLNEDNGRLKQERDTSYVNYKSLVAEMKEQDHSFQIERANFNLKISQEKEKGIKRTLTVGGIAVGVSVTTWLLGKFGVL